MALESGSRLVGNAPLFKPIGGFAIVKASSKAEAIEWAKRFLDVAGDGESEILQLHEQPAFPPE